MVLEDRRVQRFDAVTEDPGEIHELTQAMFGASVRVERSDGRPPSLRLAQAATAEIGVQRVTWNVDGRCDVAPLGRFLCIRLHRGASGLDQGGGRAHHVQGDTFLVDPGGRVDAEVIGADLDSFTIDQSALERVAAQIAPWSHGRLDFRRAVPVSPALGHAWDALLTETSRVLRQDDLLVEHPLLHAGLLYRLAATACAAFDLAPEARAERPGTTRALRRAVGHIDDHLAEPITVGDNAGAAGLSARALNEAFRRVFDTTPHAHLRRSRLHAVRHDLLHAGGSTTVAEVARRWGFQYLGRFADAYRQEFGELPRTTLHG